MKHFFSLLLALLILCVSLYGCTRSTTPPEGGEGDPPDPPAKGKVVFCGDFRVSGAEALLLEDALTEAGIPMGGADAAKVIYVGEDENASATARENATAREAHYNDFSIVCDGTSLSLYGGSTYATEQAIVFLIDNFAKDGAITMENDLVRTITPDLKNITVAGRPLSEVTVVYEEDSCLGIAANMAHLLSVACGHEIPYAKEASGPVIRLAAKSTTSELFFSYDYEWAADGDGLTLTAKSRAALSFAAQDFAFALSDGAVYAAGKSGTASCATRYVGASDTELFKYCGMWQASDGANTAAMDSYWNVAYVEIDFTGGAIVVNFSAPTNYVYSIDGGEYSAPQSATEQAVIFAGGMGKHTLRIRNLNSRSEHLHFAGVTVSEATVLSRTADRAHYIQFVGDSISDGNSFARRIGEQLGWDYSVTACAGIALEDNYGWWYVNNGYKNGAYEEGSMAEMIRDNFGVKTIGMESAFFKLGLPENYMTEPERSLYATRYYDEAGTLDCDFASGNTPDIVFIFLGTNDQLREEKDPERFVTSYVNFVGRILNTYGSDTQICMMNALTHSVPPEQNDEGHQLYTIIRQAAYAVMDKYLENVVFIDRDEITTWGVEIGSDNVHPTEAGQVTLTEKIGEYLTDLYG